MNSINTIRFSGYKSFSDESLHEIDFNSYVTTIIGKNNCGKSSVIDAIEYVLDSMKHEENRLAIRELEASFYWIKNIFKLAFILAREEEKYMGIIMHMRKNS